MAAITFPRDIPCELVFDSFSFQLQSMDEQTPLRSGAVISRDLGPALWRLRAQSEHFNETNFGVVRAWFNSLRSVESFLAYDRLREYPVLYKDGWPDFGESPAFDGTCLLDDVTDSKLVDITSLPAGFGLRPGDYLAFTYGASDSRALHMVIAGGDADGSGALQVEVRPHVRVGWEAATTVDLFQPTAKFKVVPGSYEENTEFKRYGRISFEAIQTL